MTDLDTPADGRAARRERNVNNVLDVVLEMFAEESLFPTIEQAAQRSGLSLRSLYRYFADPAELLEAVIVRNREHVAEFIRLQAIGEGPVAQRIDDFVGMRVRLYDFVGPVYRATLANAARHERVASERAANRDRFREQFALQFAQELDKMKPVDRERVLSAGDMITQLDSIDFLIQHRGKSPAEATDVLATTLRTLLA